ncbi:MAG: hypothetical protein AB7I68_13400 [Porticoccaceae bacterium]
MTSCPRISFRHLLGIACLVASASSPAGTDYQAVAAKFSTRTCALPCTQPRSGDWYLWRNENRVEIRSGSGQIGEIWRRDDKGRISLVYVEPAHKRGIAYTATDLRLIGNTRPWERLASIVDPAELKNLEPVGETEFLGHKAQRYKGDLDKRAVEVVWIPHLQLAAQVINTYPDHQVTTELQSFLTGQESSTALSEAELADYQLVDFADVGDMETTPSMAWLKQSAAPGHEHHHH